MEPGLLYLESWGQVDGVDLLDLIGTQYQLFKFQKFQETFIHQAHLEGKVRKLGALMGEAAVEQKWGPPEDSDSWPLPLLRESPRTGQPLLTGTSHQDPSAADPDSDLSPLRPHPAPPEVLSDFQLRVLCPLLDCELLRAGMPCSLLSTSGPQSTLRP